MATLVFIGKVERIEYVKSKLNRRGWIRVIEPFKGVSNGQLVETAEWDGLDEMPIYLKDDLFVFYLSRNAFALPRSAWTAGFCGRTGPVEDRGADLMFLRALPDSARGTLLSGRISTRGAPLPGVLVTIQGRYASRVVQTNVDGFYEIQGLPPGTYGVHPAAPPGMKLGRVRHTSYQLKYQHPETGTVTLDRDEHVLQDIFLRYTSSIGGRILDREGRPLGKGEVASIALEPADQRRIIATTGIQPNRRYTLDSVPPGRYRVSVVLRPSSADGPSPAPLYYPGTNHRSQQVAGC